MTYKQELEYGDTIIKKFFKDKSGKPFEATETQINIFLDIFLMRVDRVAILGMTRYGKSETVSMAILLRSLRKKENFVIVANSKDMAQILMNKCIEHLSDNPVFERNLVLVDKSLTKKLKKKESKDEFTWINGGGIRTASLKANTKKSEVNALIGEGTNRLIIEEASDVANSLIGMAMRMLGDNPLDNFCLKLGNALKLGHFSNSCESDKYKIYRITWQKALKEGRTTKEFIEEQRLNMTEQQFNSMYECKFPPEEAEDGQGYKQLFLRKHFYKRNKETDQIERIQQEKNHKGEKILGFDPSEGGDENCCQMRSETRADLIFNSHVSNTGAQANIIINLAKENEIDQGNTCVDGVGVGVGVVHTMQNKDFYCNDIRWGGKTKSNKYVNKKAENFHDLKFWIEKGGYISDEQTIEELLTIKWKERENDNKIIMKSKQLQLSEDGVKSQNRADALALTFNQSAIPTITTLEVDEDEDDDWDDDEW